MHILGLEKDDFIHEIKDVLGVATFLNISGEGGLYLYEIYIRYNQEHCPMTFVRTKLKLAQIEEGDILEVLLSEGEPLENVPKSASEQGFKCSL